MAYSNFPLSDFKEAFINWEKQITSNTFSFEKSVKCTFIVFSNSYQNKYPLITQAKLDTCMKWENVTLSKSHLCFKSCYFLQEKQNTPTQTSLIDLFEKVIKDFLQPVLANSRAKQGRMNGDNAMLQAKSHYWEWHEMPHK